MYVRTTATKKLQKLNKRIRGIAGGTSASKTISIILILIDYAQTHDNKVVSITSESFPHLKRGAMRDFLNIMQEHKYYVDDRWNRTDSIYTFEGNSKIEFFSADQPGKVRGPRRDILFINEANNISYETFTQLEVRTKDVIWLDWNPVSEFWFYEGEGEGDNKHIAVKDRDDCDFLTLTYKDNEALGKGMVEAVETRRHHKNWWRVYGLGLLGELEGKIYNDWKIIDEIPHEARLHRYGLDFGYTIDPAGIVAVYQYDGGYILDEILYKRKQSNRQLADLFLNLDRALIIADSAEPKSIDEIKEYGLSIVPAVKGKDSVSNGIQFVQDQKISVTKRSLNLIKEYRNYLWQKDRDEKVINVPEDQFNHLLDGVRYAIASGKALDWKPNDPGGIKPLYKGMPG